MVTLRGKNIFYQTCFSLHSKLKRLVLQGFTHPHVKQPHALCFSSLNGASCEKLWRGFISIIKYAWADLHTVNYPSCWGQTARVSWSVWVFWTLRLLLAKISFLLEEAEACSVFLLFHLACINIVRTVHILYFDMFLGWGTEFGWYCERSVTCIFLYFVMLPNGLN